MSPSPYKDALFIVLCYQYVRSNIISTSSFQTIVTIYLGKHVEDLSILDRHKICFNYSKYFYCIWSKLQ